MVCAEKRGEICLHLSLSHAGAELAMLFSVLFESRHLGGSPLSSSSWGWDVVWHSSGRGWGGGGGEESEEAEVSRAGHVLGCLPVGWESCKLAMQTLIRSFSKR